jgi:hypothetical protein
MNGYSAHMFGDPYEDDGLQPDCLHCYDRGLVDVGPVMVPCTCPSGKYHRDKETLTRLQREFNIAMTYGDFHVAGDLKEQMEKLAPSIT